MPRQVHCIVKKSEDFDDFAIEVTTDAEHHQVPSAPSVAGNVKREQPLPDVIALSHADDRRTVRQFGQRCRYRFCVGPGLSLTELLD